MNVIVSNKYQSLLNSLEIDVIKSINGEFEVEELINMFSNFFFNKMILDITAIKGYKDIRKLQKLSISLDMGKVILLLDDDDDSTSSLYLSRLISMGIYNFTRNKEGIMYLYNNPNTYRDVAHIHQLEELTEAVVAKVINKKVKILGIKNLTDHAGSTSLIYMLKKQLERNYSVVAIEVGKRDFTYFNDKDMLSTTKEQLNELLLTNKEADIILVDINENDIEAACNDVLYLLEPSSIKLNKLMRRNRRIFEQMAGKKIVLNKSLLSAKDVLDFENEARTQIFYNVPPLNDRVTNKVLDAFLSKLGYTKQKTEEIEQKSKILGLFKF
jgi:pyrimidine operon attenuation protein/uracil phosphoribosyltransferase